MGTVLFVWVICCKISSTTDVQMLYSITGIRVYAIHALAYTEPNSRPECIVQGGACVERNPCLHIPHRHTASQKQRCQHEHSPFHSLYGDLQCGCMVISANMNTHRVQVEWPHEEPIVLHHDHIPAVPSLDNTRIVHGMELSLHESLADNTRTVHGMELSLHESLAPNHLL